MSNVQVTHALLAAALFGASTPFAKLLVAIFFGGVHGPLALMFGLTRARTFRTTTTVIHVDPA